MICADPALRRDLAALFLEPYGVDLSPEFLEALLPRPREKLITGGTQAGKSYEVFTELALDVCAVMGQLQEEPLRKWLYWNIVPSYKSEHTEMDYLKTWGERLGFVTSAHWPLNDQLRLEFFGGRLVVETKTGQDPMGISGQPCDGVVVTEAGSMPDLRGVCQERTMTKRGWITYSGTLEDDEMSPQYTWYGETAQRWREYPGADHFSISLPSWANRSAFPGGRNDPEIKRLERERDAHSFNRRIAGIPVGSPLPVYGGLLRGQQEDWAYNPQIHGIDWVRGLSAGGHDYGMAFGHPSTLVALTVTAGSNRVTSTAVVREAWSYRGADRELIEFKRNNMSQKWNIPRWRWGFDPMQGEAAEMVGALAVKSGDGSRFARVGLVEARINNRTLAFDFNGEGVEDVFLEMRKVHLVKKLVAGHGEKYDYSRVEDDYAAATENAVWVIDGQKTGQLWRPKQASVNWGRQPVTV